MCIKGSNKGDKETVVRVEVSDSGEKPANTDSSTYQSGSRYRVYSVAVEGANLIIVHRGQLNETVKNKDIDGLIDELKTKNSGKVSKPRTQRHATTPSISAMT